MNGINGLWLVPVPPEHWFDEITPAWWFLVRVRCTCGWRSRAHATLNGAANSLIRHQAKAGRESAG